MKVFGSNKPKWPELDSQNHLISQNHIIS